MGVIEEEIAALKKQRDLVLRQLLAYRQEARTEIDPGKKVLLEEKAKQCEEKYDDLSKKIERLEHGEPPELTPKVLSRFKAELREAWEADLHWLDYDEPENRLHTLVRVKKQSAVLLYIQHRRRMKADLYIKRILKNESIFDKRWLHPPFIEDFSQEGLVDPQRFIERWLSNFKIEPAMLELKSAVQRVIQTLHGAVVTGQILCLEIRVKEVSEDFLRWFREEFWQPLVESLRHPPRGIRVIVLLTTEADLPKERMRGEWRCNSTQFDCYKYCEIELPIWDQPDIENWMNIYLNGSLQQRHLPVQNTPALAQQVYDDSDKGVPIQAHNLILGDLLTQVVDQLPGQLHATS